MNRFLRKKWLGKLITTPSGEYRVTEADLDDLPDGIDAVDVESALKYIVAQHNAGPSNAESNIEMMRTGAIDHDPVPRFIGNIIIFDGNNLAHRVWHTHNLSYKDKDVSILYGVLNVMRSTIRQYSDVACVMVCWDDGIPQHRLDKMPGYKSNRERTAEDQERYAIMKDQMNELHDFLPSLGVCSIKKQGCEADDLIYSSARMLNPDYRKIIVSSDQDLLQCVRYDTIILQPIKSIEITWDGFEEIIGVRSQDYLTYKCLIGDTSDNIPGCRGIGDKTAVKLIEQYGASPSNLINVANGDNPEAESMALGVASKLSAFGIQGFADTMATIRLDYDLCGARLSLLGHFIDWQPYDAKAVSMFLKQYAFVSLQDSEFYNCFKQLRSPESLLIYDLGKSMRMPVIAPNRQPIVA